MLQHLFDHENQLNAVLRQNSPDFPWKPELEKHQLYLYHLQRERLIHLLVTLTVALATLATCFTLLFRPSILLAILAFILIALLIPYLLHYQKLENTTQRWYQLSQILESKLKP